MKFLFNYINFFLLATLLFGCENVDSASKSGEVSSVIDSHDHHSKKFGAGLTYADSINDGLIHGDTLKTSVQRVAMENIGDCHVHIEYGSPGVRGRKIWGGLLAYDEVWAAGAHNATSIRFSKPIEINGEQIDAGTYGFFAIPGRDKWTLILNSRYKQHLADEYKQEEDLVRVDAVPEAIASVPRLTYGVEAGQKTEKGTEGFICLSWDTVQVKMLVKVLP